MATLWCSEPPRGGPMVDVDGFPGPLYPPDAAPAHEPSPHTPFALALKRTAARIGAWPWQPDLWDDIYSNHFAHGDGWRDETHAGIEGLQHWAGPNAGISVTGYVGEKTFNFLRSVKVPQGRSHAGEMAMDSVAINLINQAYEDAHPPKPETTVREVALNLARGQVGYKENPPESNLNKYGDWYGENGVPWCAIFCTWAFEQAAGKRGVNHPTFLTLRQSESGDRYDYVPYIVADARSGRYGLSVASQPKPGDLVCYDWNRNGEYDHVGIFEAWGNDYGEFQAIEGNTSTSNNSNGGEVMRRSRNKDAQGTVFVRVAEP